LSELLCGDYIGFARAVMGKPGIDIGGSMDKLKHWCGVPGKNAQNAAPVLEFNVL